MSRKNVAVIIGESGTGKSAIKKTIIKLRPDLHEVITSTTRPMREGEMNGRDYNFYGDEEMADKIFEGKMVECVEFNDWVYGTEYDKLCDDKINIGIWNPEGAESLDEHNGLETLNFYIVVSPKTRLLRALSREGDPDVDEIVRRYVADKKDFQDGLNLSNLIPIDNEGDRSLEEVATEIIKYIDAAFGQ